MLISQDTTIAAQQAQHRAIATQNEREKVESARKSAQLHKGENMPQLTLGQKNRLRKKKAAAARRVLRSRSRWACIRRSHTEFGR